MELIIKPYHGLPCELEIFTINGEDAGLGCAIWGLILIFSIIGSSILTYIINN